jgi:tetratricopeptide (TPR) repeat protein
MARALCNLGEIAREQNRLETARERCEQALAAAQDVGDEATTCYIHLSMGRIACDDGNPLEAEQHLQECFRCFRKAGTRRILVLCLLLAAHIADLWGQPERCAVLLGAGKALREETSDRLIHGEARAESRLITSARHLLGDAKYEAAFAYGQTLSSEAVTDYASRLHETAL